jgi:hypothetical protein
MWSNKEHGFTVAVPFLLKDDSRFARFGSSLCLPQAASNCIPLHLGIQEEYQKNKSKIKEEILLKNTSIFMEIITEPLLLE